MKHLFIARHGEYSDGSLNDEGKKQMKKLGREMSRILNKGSSYILSSSAPRAVESAKVLATKLRTKEIEQMVYLWSGEDSPEGSYFYYYGDHMDKLMAIINERREKAEGLVIVSHQEVTEGFPRHFFEKEFGKFERIMGLPKGCAVYFDLEQKTFKYLSGD